MIIAKKQRSKRCEIQEKIEEKRPSKYSNLTIKEQKPCKNCNLETTWDKDEGEAVLILDVDDYVK